MPPASSTSSRPAAQSQWWSPRSKKASTRPAASQARSSAAAPARRMSRTRGSSSRITSACTARRSGSYEKPVATSACPSGARVAHLQAALAQEGALPADRAERLAVDRRVHHAHERPVRVLERHADRPGREPVQEVDRAVERVYDPAPAAGGIGPRALLGHEAVVRSLGGQQLADRALGLAIGIRDEVGGRGFRRHAAGRPTVEAEQHLAGRARRALGQREVGVHRARDQEDDPDDHRGDDDHVDQEAEGLLLGAQRVQHAARGDRPSSRRLST